ncbi:hypothetical protein [Streptomyces sp. NBC_00572]|nr:hypothetical protein [Streptomyces sp. NBC_00572]MCX4986419.1 hypothetical protein [Streptomyces sp. NBC_00572]
MLPGDPDIRMWGALSGWVLLLVGFAVMTVGQFSRGERRRRTP